MTERQAREQVEKALMVIQLNLDKSCWDVVAEMAAAIESIATDVYEGIEQEVEEIGRRGR